MRIIHCMIAAAALLATAMATSSQAEPAYTAGGGATNMREGPGMTFPIIARVPGGVLVDVTGCIAGFSWCDVNIEDAEGSFRGWISSTRLKFSHAGQLVPLWSFSTFFNVPIIGGSARYGNPNWNQGGGQPEPDCADPDVLCPHEGPVECEACPWPTGRARE